MSRESQPKSKSDSLLFGGKLEDWPNAPFNFQALFIAYSGGIDSHVLLHLCANCDVIKNKLTAVYIDHGLQQVSSAWSAHCQSVCGQLGVKFLSLSVNAKNAPGESPEDAARNARYAALKPLLGQGDALLLAQHREDQLETVLLQLFRGSGLKGLSGMPKSMPFGQGELIRPLLHVSKADIIEYAKYHDLHWIEDPTNRKSDFDRNFLRNDIVPILRQRWPSLDKTVSRSARHCADAQAIIETRADVLLGSLLDSADHSLDLNQLKSLSEPKQHLVIRHWFCYLGLKMPSQKLLQQLLANVILARADADPVFSAQCWQFRRYRDRLYCVRPEIRLDRQPVIWLKQQTKLRLADREYELVESTSGISRQRWQHSEVVVKFRSGGETIELPGRKGHHRLKNLFQEAGVPPWERTNHPLIYLDGRLAAIGERWISASYFNDKQEPCFRLVCRKINPKAHDD